MKLYVINAENWKIDGGVSFGVVPKTIWNNLYPADDRNLINISSRCLLIEENSRLILIDTGMGNKRDEKYYSYRYLFGNDSLEKNIKKYGFSFDDISDVIFTHLHDDHVGGSVKYNERNDLELVFKNADFWVTKDQWNWAVHPNKRESASYFKDNFIPLLQSGKLHFIENQVKFYENIYLRIYNGHTQGQIIPMINYNGKIIVFMADFIPSAAHIPLPYIASVDIQPLITLKEKEIFLNEAVSKNYILFFEHDYYNECCTVKNTEKGIRCDKCFNLSYVLNEG